MSALVAHPPTKYGHATLHEEEVYELLCSLDTTKANGHDDISAKMLKETAMSITSAVTELFNISVRLGEIPDEWKIA